MFLNYNYAEGTSAGPCLVGTSTLVAIEASRGASDLLLVTLSGEAGSLVLQEDGVSRFEENLISGSTDCNKE